MLKVLDGYSKHIFDSKYAYPGDRNWSDRIKTVARQIASAERDEDKEKWEKRFYESIGAGEFIPGGRILFGAGRKNGQHNMLNCYFMMPEDNVDSIAELKANMYKISCSGGGIGFNMSKIRPRGSSISNMPFAAPGLVSEMKKLDAIGAEVRSGGNRRVALIGICEVTHPDLFHFLNVKLDLNQLNNFNISVAITDRFIEAVEGNEEWFFTFQGKKYLTYEVTFEDENGEIYTDRISAFDTEDAKGRADNFLRRGWDDQILEVKYVRVKAREIWDRIWRSAVKCGCPGIFNISFANEYTNVSYFEYLPGTNPCGEITLPPYGNCDLAAINLAEMFDKSGRFDVNKLRSTVKTAVRFLDNVLTVNNFPIPECREVGHRSRRIGLGVMGLHHMFIKMGIKYGSDRSLEFAAELFSKIRNEAYKASAYLAREKGAFPAFDSKKYLAEAFAKTLPVEVRMLIREHGIRNAVMLTVAPTGTTAMLMGVSTGIEPIFAPMYKRRTREKGVVREEVLFDPLFREFVINKRPLDNFVCAYDIDPVAHLKMQATVQKYVDSSISKTINLPEEMSEKQIDKFIEKSIAFAPYIKGATLYKAGSKGDEPLKAIPVTEENIKKYLDKDAYAMVSNASFCSIDGVCE